MRVESINAVGLPCPLPVVRVKKAFAQPDVGCVRIKVDNFIAVQNLEKMAGGLGFGFEHARVSESEFDVVLVRRVDSDIGQEKQNGQVAARSVVDFSESAASAATDVLFGGSFVVAIGSDAMGRGSDELGKVLMKAFIYSLTELDTCPQTVLFFNSGAFLTSADSGAIEDLQALVDSGTKVLTCGACIDYYKLAQPTVGDVTNMFEIASIMSKAQKLVSL